jgi:hypothetical protein
MPARKRQPPKAANLPTVQLQPLLQVYVRLAVYEPFRLGGGVHRLGPMWIEKKYLIPVSNQGRIGDFEIWVVHDQQFSGQYRIYEKTTGGGIGHGPDEGAALADAIHNIAITPDLKDQIAAAAPLEGLAVIDTEEALKMLAKSRDA